MADYNIVDEPSNVDFEMVRGDDWSKNFTITDSDGDAIDLTGSTIYLTLRTDYDASDSDDSDAAFTQDQDTFSGAGNNEFTLSIPDTSSIDFEITSYKYDISWKSAAGVVKTLFRGKFKITDTATNRDITS